MAFDGMGNLRGKSLAEDGSRESCEPSPVVDDWRISRQGVHLICSSLSGRVIWRAIAEEPLGLTAVGHAGVAALIGRSLAWFKMPGTLP